MKRGAYERGCSASALWTGICHLAGGAGDDSPHHCEGHRGIFNVYQLMLADGTPQFNIHPRDGTHIDVACLWNTTVGVYRWAKIRSQQPSPDSLQRLLSDDEEKSKTIMQEVCLMRRLSGHANIVQFVSAASVGKEESDTGKAEFLILTELCQGQLVDALKQAECRGPLPSDTVLKIFYQTCRAVQHLHRQNPPITHRDLKIENLLLSSQATIKLCDFGSATTARHSPNYSWSAARRANVEEEIARNTTPIYRAPEVLDLYSNLPITEKQDVWVRHCHQPL
uniref:Protein kinase domain-containing protein n=1 Tax=Eptatretus burgeri TaxID=7764 RepID=A0A8C4R8P2_EPTBU